MTLKTRLLRLWGTINAHITANRIMAAFTVVIAAIGFAWVMPYDSN